MDKAIMFGLLAFAATLLVAGGAARETGEKKGFECQMHEAMEKAGYASMEQMHAAMHGNGTECPMLEAMEKNGLNETTMEQMHEAMHGNSTGGCPMMQGIGPGPIPGMMPPGPGGMMGMMQRGR